MALGCETRPRSYSNCPRQCPCDGKPDVFIQFPRHYFKCPAWVPSCFESLHRGACIFTVAGFHRICQIIDPKFDASRLVTKVPATWEGMQAARQLKRSGIKTLATTLFSMEQAILAGEAGCVSISPFIHELKTQMVEGWAQKQWTTASMCLLNTRWPSPSYKDTNPILGVCVQAQQFYKQSRLPTRVKACVTLGLDELMSLAGVDALTIMPDDIKSMAVTERPESEVKSKSLFSESAKSQEHIKYPSYIDSEAEYRIHFASSQNGKAQFKTAQVFNSHRACSNAKLLLTCANAGNRNILRFPDSGRAVC